MRNISTATENMGSLPWADAFEGEHSIIVIIGLNMDVPIPTEHFPSE